MSKIKFIFASKVAVITVFLTLIWIVTDISQRLFQELKQSSSVSNPLDVQPVSLPNVTTQTMTKITQVYEKYRTVVQPVAAEVSGMTVAEQAKQSGELSAFFVGERKLELKAVLNNQQQLSVLLQVTHVKEKSFGIEKFNDLDKVYGFQLKVINNVQVQLSKQNNNQQQLIILTMYNLDQKKI